MQSFIDILAEPNVEYNNNILKKSFNFCLRILKFYKFELEKKRSFEPLLKQLLRSGTSVGANIAEAQSASSKKDFINKLNISLKECRESEFWIRLLREADIISEKEFRSLHTDCVELIKIITSIIKSAKINN